jgi:hypothetical protein
MKEKEEGAKARAQKSYYAGEDIQFLVQVLHPDPNDRLTVQEILDSGYLDE